MKRMGSTGALAKFAALGLWAGLLSATGGQAQADTSPPPTERPDQTAFRGLFKELVETNTALSVGSCTLAATRMAAHLRAAGLPERQITLFSVPDHPKEGGLVAIYPGTSASSRPILLLAHLDVVEARREDWIRDPFTLIEDGPYLFARGSFDDKAMAAIWTDTIARFAASHYAPRRTIKLALTCGEETSGAFNGADWLARNKRDLIDAQFALNEGGGGRTDGKPLTEGGHLIVQTVQVGEKAYEDFTLTVINPGGHSSQPVRDNAIYVMADALARVRDLEFPLEFNDTTRTYFREASATRGGETGKAMLALATNPADKNAEAIVNSDKMLHSMLRTTCVATLISGGHALNALPQRVTANINCRMFPGRTVEETRGALISAIGNPAVSVEIRPPAKAIAKAPPLDPAIIGPMQRLAARYFPGVPFMPTMSTGATDGVYLEAAGIPTYGAPGLWVDPDANGMHGLNERIEIRSLFTGRDYLFDLVKAYAQ